MPRFAPAVCLLWACGVCAGDVHRAEVRYERGSYRLLFEVEVNAPVDSVYAILTDFDHLYRLSPAVVESARLPPDGGRERRRLAIRGCVLIFCRKVVMIEDVERIGTDLVVTTIIPAKSDFRSGRTEWQLQDAGDGRCRIRLASEVRPAFWVPPLIGPAIIKRKLLSEAGATLVRIEELVRRD